MKSFIDYIINGVIVCLLLFYITSFGCVSFSCTSTPAASYTTLSNTPLTNVQYCLPSSVGPTTFSVFSQGQVGQVTITSTTNTCFTFNYVPHGVCGTDCFIIEAVNQSGQSFLSFQVALFSSSGGSINPLTALPLNISVCENATGQMAQVAASPPLPGNVFSLTGTGPQHGGFLNNPPIGATSGLFTYKPNINYTGPDSFLFQVANGSTVVYNTVSINVTEAPTTDNFVFNSCVGTTTTAMLNVQGGTPAYTYNPNPASTKGVPITQPLGNSSPIFSYQPTSTGADSFNFFVEDSADCISNISTGSTVVSPPLVAGPVSFTACSGISVTLPFNPTGGHPGSYSYVIPSGRSGAPTKGTAVVNGNGTFTYTPSAGTSGTDSFNYFLGDGTCAAVSGTITATIHRTPELVYQQNVSTCENVTLTGIVTDDSLSQTLTATLISGPNHGRVTFAGLSAGFEYTYSPTGGYVGSDSFLFSAVNVTDTTCNATGPVNITVLAAPTVGAVSVSGCAGLPVTGVLLPTGGSGSYQNYMIINQPAHGRVVGNTQFPNFQYLPTAGFSGTDSFTYAVEDTDGCLSGIAPVSVLVTQDAEGVAQSLTGCANSAISGQLLSTGGSGNFSFGIAPSQDSNFVFKVAPIPLTQGTITAFNATAGTFTYQFNASNSGVETFYFALIGCAQFQLLPVQIIGITTATVSPISFTTCKDGSYSGTLIATGGSGVYSFTYLNGPNHGTLNPFNATAGTFTYNATAGFSGQDTFSYKAISGGCASNSALATITVSNTVAPIVQNLTTASCENGSVIGNFTASGGSGDYQYALVSGPTIGAVVFVNSSTGEFIYQAPTNFTGTASFTYSATDVITSCVGSTGTVTVTVGCT